MSNTYTGNLDATPFVFTTQPAQFFPDDRQGTMVEIDTLPSGATVDGIFFFNSSTSGKFLARIIDGSIRAVYCGIYASNTAAVNSTILNAALASSSINEIIFDDPKGGDFDFSGTINGGGKKLIFKNKNKITGTNTIDNFILDCALTDQCFTIDTILTNAQSVNTEFTCEYFGALGNGTDETAILQKTSDTIIANTTLPRIIKLLCDKTYGTKGWILHNWNGTDYGQFSISIIGEQNSMGGNPAFTATLSCINSDGFGICVQRATGFTIKGINFTGALTIPGVSTYEEYYSRDYATFASANGVRDSRYSPYCAIAIDGFRNTNTLPPDNGYPGYNGLLGSFNWYRGTSGSAHTGSTAGTMEDLTFSGFTVGIMVSPNGESQQGENMIIRRILAGNVKSVTGWGQRESKGCMLLGGYSIDRVYNILDGISWGFGSGTLPYVKGYTTSGSVIQFVNGNSQHPVTFEDIYTETNYRIGDFQAGAGRVKFLGCNFVFNTLPNPLVIPPTHFTGTGVEFDSCTIRYYDDLFNKRCVFEGSAIVFKNCFFDLPPIGGTGQDHPGSQRMINININDSVFNGNGLIGYSTLKGHINSTSVIPAAYGHMTVEQQNENNYGRELQIYECGGYENIQTIFGAGNYTVNSTAHTAIFNAGNIDVAIGQYIFYYYVSSNNTPRN